MAAWGWPEPMRDRFLQQQLAARTAGYAAYEGLLDVLIVVDDAPVGRLITAPEDDAVRVVDVALLPHARSQGLGTAILGDLLARGPVRLSTQRGSRAEVLYRRLGFVESGGDDVYRQWRHPGVGSGG